LAAEVVVEAVEVEAAVVEVSEGISVNLFSHYLLDLEVDSEETEERAEEAVAEVVVASEEAEDSLMIGKAAISAVEEEETALEVVEDQEAVDEAEVAEEVLTIEDRRNEGTWYHNTH
jgi:hypothetical protein